MDRKNLPLPNNHLVGITETSDPSFHLEIFDDLYRANIIVTKRLTDKLIDKLVEHKDKCILHLTCTGLGSSILEPMVPTKEMTFEKFNKLIEKGFPVEQVVLRIDPIISTHKGMQTALSVVKLFKNSGITRIRYSSYDQYKHVIERFHEAGIPLPQNCFDAPKESIILLSEYMLAASIVMGADLEVCGEKELPTTGCISQKDIDILGLTDEIILSGSADQRGGCLCPKNKTQLIKNKPGRCENACLYCFWRDSK